MRGLHIHQSRTKCGRAKKQGQRTGVSTLGETTEFSEQDHHHSLGNLHEPESVHADASSSKTNTGSSNREVSPDPLLELLSSPTDSTTVFDILTPSSTAAQIEKRERIKWPSASANAKKEWVSLDDDIDSILESSLSGDVEKKISALTTITYTVAKERFGLMDQRIKKAATPSPNRRERQIKAIRNNLRSLKKQYRSATEFQRLGLQQVRDMERERLMNLRKAESLRRKRKDNARTRAAFTANPFKFTKGLLDGEKSGKLECSKAEIEKHLEDTHNDSNRDNPLGQCPRIVPEDLPEFAMDTSEPTWKEVKDVVTKARSGSAPGPSGIPYKVYKMCPKLLRRLWSLIRVVWRKGKIPSCWQIAEGFFAPKEKNADNISQFRTISLLSVEGKVFFSVLAKRLTTYMTNNNYVDTSIQKGGVPGFSGCVEHTSALSQLIKEARIRGSDLTLVWLDLANAYGSIPHQLIMEALQHYHVPDPMQNLIKNYFSNIKLRFTVRSETTRWIDLERGIVTGCTISVILFVMGMNLIIKSAERETRGPKTESGIRLPANRGFMDDLTISTESHIQTRWILKALDETVSWARMKFKPKKSRCLVIRKGKVTDKFPLCVQNETIPSLTNNPIKCLGKWFDASLKDGNNVSRLRNQVQEGMKTIDKTGLPGKYKAWMYQHGLLPRLTWPLTLYEIPTTAVEELERTVSKHLRRWLGVPPSFTSIGLYGKSTKLQLPLSSLVDEFKVAKTRLVVTLRDSRDQLIRQAGIETRTGRKWSASQAVEQAESRLRHRDIVGTTCENRQGLGSGTPRCQWKTAEPHDRRAMVQQEVREQEEEVRRARAVQLGSQGAWTKWNLPERQLTWSDIWQYEPLRLKFLLRSVYDVLPTPANLNRWKLTENPECSLCGKIGTLEHILSSCRTALTQGRYRWRHDAVLRQLADVLERERKKKRPKPKPGASFIPFVKEGTKATAKAKHTGGILPGASDWELKADLDKKLVFPPIVQTSLRPDIVLHSPAMKRLVMIELTVPWETRCQTAHELKMNKYTELQQMCRERGWQTWLYPVEIGCRGFSAQSVWTMLGALGIVGRERRVAVRVLGSAAEKASSWLWYKREQESWKPFIEG